MPETRLNMPKLPPRQWFSSVHPATAVANGKSQTMENPTRSQTRLNLRLVSGECMVAPSGAITAPASLKRDEAGLWRCTLAPAIRGDYCPGLIEARQRAATPFATDSPSGAITAPASLKQDISLFNNFHKVRPSGAITAPASLKRRLQEGRHGESCLPSGAITAPASLKL